LERQPTPLPETVVGEAPDVPSAPAADETPALIKH